MISKIARAEYDIFVPIRLGWWTIWPVSGGRPVMKLGYFYAGQALTHMTKVIFFINYLDFM